MKVMIVEDEILVRLGLRKAIPWSSLGMELVCEAQDGDEAYELFKRHLPDIVLVDIELPKMDGLQFIRFAKGRRADSRFVVLTCHQDMKYMREAIQLQVNDFILKSTLDMDELCAILRSLSLDVARDREAAEKAGLAGQAVATGQAELASAAASNSSDSAERAFYGEPGTPNPTGEAFLEALPEEAHKLRKRLSESLESLRFAAARQQLGELTAELRRQPRAHPHVVKNMMTEFLFRSWSACEELLAGRQAADHRLVDRIYAAARLEEAADLLARELERLEGSLALTNSAEDKEKVVALIKQYIKTHLDREVTLQEIAGAFYINSSYLSRLFKEVSRVSFTEFVLYEKTELAIVMMKNGKSLTEISERLGYLNLSSFTRMFKKVRGVSPSKYSER
ncbi:response regulator [Cohnella xylanilytica]|uniref:Response regulator n=1 Tax=Cohnella xylanilytica TaxID=557555 RepID=A0A841U4V9_9BACL|nr:response regulator [Cohnella xylanilytica]MBB6695646.1 response regulator [Cohnella xylanilytica]